MPSMTMEPLPNIFRITVPLPGNPLGHLNSYLVKSDERNILIDTGLNCPQGFRSLSKGIKDAGVGIGELTDILLTHFHVDHIGLVPSIAGRHPDAKILIHEIEKDMSRIITGGIENYQETAKTFLENNGASSSISSNVQRFHPAFSAPEAYEILFKSSTPMKDRQELSVGDYTFQVIWTPGHSPGHVCLYEPSLKILFSGDHLLPTITPHVAQFMENMNPLKDYFESLQKITEVEVESSLPAHEQAFTGLKERVRQLKKHHEMRLMGFITELRHGSLTAYTLASKSHWDVKYRSWDDFPVFHKYLALGETLAHLTFLENKGLIERTRTGQLISYHLRKNVNPEDPLHDIS